MPMKKHKPEQIVALLRQIEVGIANGKTTPQACREVEITEDIFTHISILTLTCESSDRLHHQYP